MRRVLLLGYYGMFNTGDDAMVYGLVRHLSALSPSTRVIVQSPVRLTMPTGLPVRFDHSQRIRFLKRVLWRYSVYAADTVVWGGGGLLYYHLMSKGRPRNLSKIRQMNAFAKSLGRPVHLIGISVGPVEGGEARKEVLRIVGDAASISVRDSESARILDALGFPPSQVAQCMDPAILLLDDLGPGPQSHCIDGLCLGIALRPVFTWMERNPEKDRAYIDSVCEALRCVLNRISNLRLRAFVFHAGGSATRGDEDVTRMLVTRLGRYGVDVEAIPYHPDPRQTLAEIGRCSHVFAVRYHAAVFAYMNRVPFLDVDYQSKCQGFLRDIGLEANSLVNLSDILDPVLLAERLSCLLNSPQPKTLDVQEAYRRARLCVPCSLCDSAG